MGQFKCQVVDQALPSGELIAGKLTVCWCKYCSQ